MSVVSTAPRAKFAFGQGTDDGKCHLSFNKEDEAAPVNFLLTMQDAAKLAENLVRVLDSERIRLLSELAKK